MKVTLSRLLCGALAVNTAHGLDYYVSGSGNDEGGGTKDQPFKTLRKAQQAVRNLLLQGAQTEDINIRVSPGVFPLTATLVFNSPDSGKNGFRVNWIGNNTILSGGLRLTGWTQGTSGVYSATIPVGTESRNLYVNGMAANYARRKINRKDVRDLGCFLSYSIL
jgi:hypothetical protein